MSEIKFHKAEELPSPINSTHDGVWLIADGANNYKHFVITGGVVKELIVDGEDLTLEQARQNGNVLEGDIVIKNYSSGQLDTGFISEDGNSQIAFSDEGGIGVRNLQDNISSFIYIHSNYASMGVTNQVSGNQIYMEAAHTGGESHMRIISNDINTKGLIGNDEFDKQGDRKAFAQIADVEDAIDNIVITETDPTVPNHVKAITSTQVSNWDTAFGWGDHALAGYLENDGLTNNYLPKLNSNGKLTNSPLIEETGRVHSTKSLSAPSFIGKTKVETFGAVGMCTQYDLDFNDLYDKYIIKMDGCVLFDFSNVPDDTTCVTIELWLQGTEPFSFLGFEEDPYSEEPLDMGKGGCCRVILSLVRSGTDKLGVYQITNFPNVDL